MVFLNILFSESSQLQDCSQIFRLNFFMSILFLIRKIWYLHSLSIYLFIIIYQVRIYSDMGQESSFVHKEGTHRVAVLSGSLRKASTNTGLLRAINDSKHPAFSFDYIDISDFPVFNEDVEAKGIPGPVRKARDQIYAADAVLFAIPEYNLSMSSPFKNAFDWLSRGYSESQKDKEAPVKEKIAAMVSSGGGVGGQRAQKHFRESSAVFCKVKLMETDEKSKITVQRFAGKIFDEEGSLIDEETKKKLVVFLDCFDKWIKENKK